MQVSIKAGHLQHSKGLFLYLQKAETDALFFHYRRANILRNMGMAHDYPPAGDASVPDSSLALPAAEDRYGNTPVIY